MISRKDVDKISVVTVDGTTFMGDVKVEGDKLVITNAYPLTLEDGLKSPEITLKKADVYFRKFNKEELDTITLVGVKGYTTRNIRRDEQKVLNRAWEAMEHALKYVDADSVNQYFKRQLEA